MPKAVKKTSARKPARKAHKGNFDLPLAPVVRIAKRSGAERISNSGTKAIMVRTEKYIAGLARQAAHSASAMGRKTMRAEDVEKF
jgi:histone H3/H4